MLTDRQVAQFDAFGFCVLRGVLGAGELDTARAEFDIGLARAAAGTERRGIRKQLNWSNLGPDTPFLGLLLEDARFVGAAERFYGQQVIGYYANANSFDGDRTEWHPDTSTLIRRGVKFAFYLQPLDEHSGGPAVRTGITQGAAPLRHAEDRYQAVQSARSGRRRTGGG